ncbi:MAG: hypothetical protein A3F26_00160 [Candidatus Ryanbacteria bacterium RIFCSPHIGHO2_12_FULL_47_12b]|uniref:Transposase IS200-like domain-containing protein n=3 Tax=Parcubacteria group TaxID=1794811 RepID=A0A1G2H7P9_9BACT|nr:MAG: Transposase [Parcubacteria group bacterium GW2011_GWA2_47_10b]KKU76381.1 MAG: Transposase [Candidatus Giovannonibacteria bacterium GW2011_GWB1_47_6b]OGZ48051.1 MAG: hypothetical protein A3C83_02800 [Candidatus Ryanbacteria bacterium RIFCSPHIGHO2_02_FULL_47_25]OGZ51368.1 MAG: hypothetical protein A3A29_02025 [Candidatus Ryanbacteria bacterium RIFCSPLOWO2_01_FULL_47_79]OGZ51823.1 MAG: hypothetical protein A3F26_00160 [Candidatus Ryanbacteria bacterium RIFCSPHIGHO2_12_FULL_47_12b]OGZ54845
MERKIVFASGEYYHIYNRGVEMRDVFLDDGDYLRFQRLLYIANGKQAVIYKLIQGSTLESIERGGQQTAIGAYVLMPNHFHLLVKEMRRGGITEFLRKLTTGYSMYFNKKYERVGALFQGTFKAEHVDRDEYLKYLFAYIHLNPIKIIESKWKESGVRDIARAKNFIAKYRYSSYPDCVGVERTEKIILSAVEFPKYFKDAQSFADFHKEWLQYKDAANT